MRQKKVPFILLIGLIFLTSSSFAQIPSPLQNVKVTSIVTLDSTTGIYEYRYSIFNPPVNDGDIFLFEIDIAKPLNTQELSSKDLVIQRGMNIDGKMVLGTFEEEVARIKEALKKPVIPVGAQPPLGYPFPGWGVGIAVMGTVMWGGSEQSLILPNETLEGFILTSYGLPGITETKIQPDLDLDALPIEYYENVELTKQLEDSLVYVTKTIGPTAPPKDLDPSAFIDYIIGLKHQAFDLGWIDNQGIVQGLDIKLTKAKDRIACNNSEATINILKAFINEVEAQSCESYDNCPKGKHLKPEAYSLLKYNTQYLIDSMKRKLIENSKREDINDIH